MAEDTRQSTAPEPSGLPQPPGPSTLPDSLKPLEERLGHRFANPGLLMRALTHPSYVRENSRATHYQRMEFLGDSVLGLVLAEALFELLPDQREGVLTRYRSILVRGQQLARIAREIRLGDYLRIAEAERANGARDLDSILEDAFEALIAAVYLDAGLEKARSVALCLYGDLNSRLDIQLTDANPKGRLQELLQPKVSSQDIEYRVTETTGPDHQKAFTVEVWIAGELRGSGSGNSKKTAEEAAAREALERLAQ